MPAGVTTPNIDRANFADELIGNRGGNTVRIPMNLVAAAVDAEIPGPNYRTRAELFSDLNWPKNTRGTVWGDADEAQRGQYRKAGGAEAGSWAWFAELPQTSLLTEQLKALVDRINLAVAAAPVLGNWDAAGGAFPATRPDGTPIMRGDAWLVTGSGTVDGEPFSEGDYLQSLVPGGGATFAGHWGRAALGQVARDRANAALSAAQAALYDGPRLDTYATLLADTGMTYTPGQPGTVQPGDFANLRQEGLAYQVLASGASSPSVQTAGGVKLDYASPTVYVDGFGAKGDGVTNDSAAFQKAMDALPSGGNIVLTRGKTYLVQGLTPRSGVTIQGQSAKMKLPPGASSPIIYRHESGTVRDFNLHNIQFDGGGQAQNLVQITRPGATAPSKTWQYSTVFGCTFLNSGGIGVYCDIPGRVRVQNCWVYGCDIGVAWDREHIDLYGTQIESNRIGVRSTGNHFAAVHCSIAHNTEVGWTTEGAGLGLYKDVYEAGFIGCTFLDNPTNFRGRAYFTRFIGNRFTGSSGVDQYHFDGSLSTCTLIGNMFNIWGTAAIRGLRQANKILGNFFTSGASAAPAILSAEAAYINSATALNQIVDNYFERASVAIDVSNPTYGVSYNVISRNVGYQVGCLIRAADVRSHNEFDGNAGYQINLSDGRAGAPGRGIDLTMWSASQTETLSVCRNKFLGTPLEAIKVSSASNLLSLSIDGNHVFDANTSNTADTDAISVGVASLTCSGARGNTVRNSGAGFARYAIGLSGTAQDSLLDGNIARNMKGVNAYKVPATGITQGTNIGTVDAA